MSKKSKKKKARKKRGSDTRVGADPYGSSSGDVSSRTTRSRRMWMGVGIAVALAAVAVLAATRGTEEETSESPADAVEAEGATEAGPSAAQRPPNVPPYYSSAEAGKPFPQLLPASVFGDPVVRRAYEIAHEIPEVLVQQPCYCWCERMGHGSLLSCFSSQHGGG